MTESIKNATTFSLLQIAGWQIPDLLESKGVYAVLPSLQRGVVWKTSQAELLWDSIMRGFPIGAIMLAPYDPDRGNKSSSKDDNNVRSRSPDYHLLDGQQRCNAIALGWFDHWQPQTKIALSAMWLDLDPPEANDERDFIFRVVTNSHPWGYQRNKLTDRLSAPHRGDAWTAYTSAMDKDVATFRASELPLQQSWPWDAYTPVPFAMLREAVELHPTHVWNALEEMLSKRLKYWNISPDIHTQYGNWKQKVLANLQKPTEHMDKIVRAIKSISEFRIPALILQIVPGLDNNHSLSKTISDNTERQDPVATWFIRVNSQGTPINGEELMYSILKSIWPGAHDAIEGLSKRFMAPSRMVMLASRLILARKEQGEAPPSAPDVKQFRRLIYDQENNFRQELETFFTEGQAQRLFEATRELLVYQEFKEVTTQDFRLPVVLMGELARHSPDAFFLLLVWLDRMKDAEISAITENTKRRLLGVLTAVGWFAYKPDECLKILWKRLLDKTNENNVAKFFSGTPLHNCLKLNDRSRDMCLIPLPPPEILNAVLKEKVTNARGSGKPDNYWWKNWTWWSNFSTFDEDWTKFPTKAQSWYTNNLRFWTGDDGADEPTEKMLSAWTAFVDRLYWQKSLVLYAQRYWISNWYPNFDPASPFQLEDTDRPWDMDHIHPQKYIYNLKPALPKIIGEWHGSIGNLRAWPLELNRADGEKPPRFKLSPDFNNPGQKNLKGYGLGSAKTQRIASFVDENKDWQHWQDSSPTKLEETTSSYLKNIMAFPNCPLELLRAITKRFEALYEEWYNNMKIGDLM